MLAAAYGGCGGRAASRHAILERGFGGMGEDMG